MPSFIAQGRFIRQAVQGMLAKPGDRAEAVNQRFAKSDGKLTAMVSPPTVVLLDVGRE